MKIKCLIFISLFNNLYLQAQVELSLNLEKGRNYCISTTSKTTIIQTIIGKEYQTVNTENGSYCYEIIEDQDSVFLAKTVFTHLSQQLESTEEGNSSFDSDHPVTDNVASVVISRLLNKPFFVLLSKDYTWKETKGLDSILLHISDDYKLPPDTKKYLDSVMLEMVKEFTRNDADLTAVLYSKKKIIPGNMWTTSTTTDHIVPSHDSMSYYLAETGGDLLTLTGSGTVTSTSEEEINGEEIICYDLKGTTEATVTYFKNSLWIKQATLRTELNGDAKKKDVKNRNTYNIPMKIIIEAKLEGYQL